MKSPLVFTSGLRRFAWLPIVTGLICIGLGIWCLCSPMDSLVIFAYVFAGCLCAAGLINVSLALGNASVGWSWGWTLALGILEGICGIWLFTLPAPVVTTAFIFFIGIWIIVAAINALCESFVLSAHSVAWTVFSVLLLLATIVLAFMFITNPITGGVAVWLWIGLSLIFFGAYRLGFGIRMQQYARAIDHKYS
ncbi:MAG: DUF308 domain-containing protein [Muribaculaceae bacterium]|nr:DUF308 domain-containing protein [Muribaculaceae bacterium]